MNKLLKFGYSGGCCGADEPTCVSVVLNWYPTDPEQSMPFEQLCMAHAFFREHLPNHSQDLHNTSSKICTKSDAHSLFLCEIHHAIATGQIHYSKQKDIKNWHVHQTHEILYNSQDMLVLSSTAVSCYNCCTDGSISPGNYEHRLIFYIVALVM
jgi:hypothetical protein